MKLGDKQEESAGSHCYVYLYRRLGTRVSVKSSPRPLASK